MCAYIGVPEDHWLADMDALHFDCHWGVTFNGPGGDSIRPAGWYWYGWDYAHYGDQLRIPDEIQAIFKENGLVSPFSQGKRWTLEELEHDIIDVAVNLRQALLGAEQVAERSLKQIEDKA